jgi:transcriptional regulator GlxA family with amidase domain
MQRIGLVLAPNFRVVSLAALAVFEIANASLGAPAYELVAVSETGAPVTTWFGMTVTTQPFDRRPFDTLLVSTTTDLPLPTRALHVFLTDASKTARRIGSICVGAFTLGEIGLLDGRRATTHWAFAAELQRRFPKAKVETDSIFTEDRRVWTSAGMTADTDLALRMVEQDHGREFAQVVARSMLIERRRSGGDPQQSVLLDIEPTSDAVQRALAYARTHLDGRLTVETLARAASLSRRQFARLFRGQTGGTPAKAVESLRLEAARLMLEQSALHIDVIAKQVGFGDHERMRRAFVRTFGRSPQTLRNAARPETD